MHHIPIRLGIKLNFFLFLEMLGTMGGTRPGPAQSDSKKVSLLWLQRIYSCAHQATFPLLFSICLQIVQKSSNKSLLFMSGPWLDTAGCGPRTMSPRATEAPGTA